MSELELFISKQIKILVPSFETIELKASVSTSSFSIEFFATINGKRMQCFEMIDEGMFTEKDFNAVSKTIANYFRGLPNFKANSINKYTVLLKENSLA